MVSSWVTYCPHCATAFRLNEEQWQQANGQVRCGSCMQIFAAQREGKQVPTRHRSVLEVPAAESLQHHQGHSLDSSNKQQLFEAMQEAPVLLDDQSNAQRNWRGVWLLGALLGLVALPLQFLWFNQQQLAYSPPYDAAYQVLCQWVSCDLPQQQDIAAIRVNQLNVRAHPQAEQAVIVDMLLFNSAKFDQPFPLLELVFSDDFGEVVGQRRLLPNQYLGGELAGAQLMPAEVSVRLSLEFVDPGSAAKAYQVELYSALKP